MRALPFSAVLTNTAVVDIDIDVEDPLVLFEQLEDGEDYVVDVAESGRFAFFGVVKPPGPVDGDVGSCTFVLYL